MSHEQTKAAHYIQQLDQARCEGNWESVPELVRKVRKHAPARSCLTLTAEAEHAIAQSPSPRPPTASRPGTATSVQASPIAKYIPQLLDAIEKERTYPEEAFQAQTCLGWIHWYLGEPALAAGRLPKNVEGEFSQLDGTNKDSAEWTRVCALKASYIKGSSQVRTGALADALETFESALPVFATVSEAPKHGRELTSWTELYLTGFCMIASHAIKMKVTSVLESETLSAFRAWAKFWESQSPAPTGGRALQADASRRQVWKEYYITLTDLLQQELPFPMNSLTVTYQAASTKLPQRAELKRVEARYETLLLSETEFPKADEVGEEVEAFVEMVMQNWRIFCGDCWKEQDLGEGGAEAISRGVLDILYRAATKTFHSTAILRNLFTVHLAIAEFDLAFKAFDTYLDIVKKGKARIEKSGDPEPGLDDDGLVLLTASECIKAMCQYGSREDVEKAKDLGEYFETWLNNHHPDGRKTNDEAKNHEDEKRSNLGVPISPKVFAMAWRCIGISHAQWARSTFEASQRSDIQVRAISCLRRALSPEYESTTSVETLFALGTILAERRELATAIEVVKSGLVSTEFDTDSAKRLGPHTGQFARERSLIPLWHLLALLLSARQEFLMAARSCEGAFEQFKDPRNLFGEADLTNPYRSDHLKSNEKSALTSGAVDEMDDFEKQNVLEVKMTQLTLIEVLEGPETAVNASDELLSLYARLFGEPLSTSTAESSSQTATTPPKSSAGTIRSIKGSIFGRSGRSARKSGTVPIIEESPSAGTPKSSRTTPNPKAPVIQVTNENGSTAKQHNHLTKESPVEKQRRTGSLSSRKDGRNRSTGRRTTGDAAETAEDHPATTIDGEDFFTPVDEKSQWAAEGSLVGQLGSSDSQNNSSEYGGAASQPRPLPPKSQQMSHKEKSLQPAAADPAKAQDNRLPYSSSRSSTIPGTRFPRNQERRRRLTTLVKVWLLIAGFYRRAAMYEDAKGAIEEASKLTQRLEEDVSRDTTGCVSLSKPGWGGGKSVEEMWGAVFAERGYLAVAESSPHLALQHFEVALTHFTDHPSAIVGLSELLLDVYEEKLLPPPSTTPLHLPGANPTPSAHSDSTPDTTPLTKQPLPTSSKPGQSIADQPLGISISSNKTNNVSSSPNATPSSLSSLSPSMGEKPASTSLLDRLSARDRAYGLLSMLTKLGSGWNHSEAWFTLARAYELGGQVEKAREVLWWCVELEESKAVRDWTAVVGGGGYVLPGPET